jgi:ABC-2 type transport system ATP-binding protein
MLETEPVIIVRDLKKNYGALAALDRVSLEVGRGEIFGVVGPNGAGKTTTVEILAGLRKPGGGFVRVLSMDPERQERELRQRIGIQLQSAALPEEIQVWEALDLFSSFYSHRANWKTLIETWGLGEKFHARFGSLSGGQRQRLFIALALVNDPELVFLDEITTGLDPQARRGTWDLLDQLRNQGKTVVLVTHYMDEAERLCDRVAIIDHGHLIALDTPQELIRGLNAGARIRFSYPKGETVEWLRAIPGVSQVERQNGEVILSGDGALLVNVAAGLAQAGVVPPDLRSEQATLEDVFLSLTGREIRTE